MSELDCPCCGSGDLEHIVVWLEQREDNWRQCRACHAEWNQSRRSPEPRDEAPAEPTEAMIDAGVAMALQVSVHGQGGWSKYVAALYRQMVAAASNVHTTPPEPMQVGEDVYRDAVRYGEVRTWSPVVFANAWEVNIKTNKPFDEIVDDLRALKRTGEAVDAGPTPFRGRVTRREE